MEEITNINEILSEIDRVVSPNRVLQSEQVILRCITFFDVALRKSNPSTLDFNKINKSLCSLLKIGNGDLSLQCSISISKHLITIFKMQKSPPFEETMNELLKIMTPSSIVAIGDLCSEFGEMKTEIVYKSINSLKNQINNYETFYSLQRIFRGWQKIDLSQFAYPIYQIIVKNYATHDPFEIIAFKLLRSLIPIDNRLPKLSADFAESILKKNNISQFVRNEAIKLAAKSALYSNYNDAFSILQRIMRIQNYHSSSNAPLTRTSSLLIAPSSSSMSVVTKYFEKLPIDQIISDSKLLFNYVISISPNSIYEISPFLPKQIREDYFGQILTQKNHSIEQISILNALQIDTYSTASLALHMARSKIKSEQEYSISYLQTIDDGLKEIFLNDTIQKLKQIKNQFLFTSCDYFLLNFFLNNKNQNAENFLKHLVQNKMYQNPIFWNLISFFEDSKAYIVQTEMVESAIEAITSNGNHLLIESLVFYFSNHSNPVFSQQVAVLLKFILSHYETLSNRCLISLINLCISFKDQKFEVYDQLVSFFVLKFIHNPPNLLFYSTLLKQPMIISQDRISMTRNSTLRYKSIELEPTPKTLFPDSQFVSQQILLHFHELFELISNKDQLIKLIISNVSKESHALLLQLVKHKMIKLNIDTLLSLLTGKDYLRLELTCEIISLLNPPIDTIYNYSLHLSKSSPIPFLLMSAVLGNSEDESSTLLYLKPFLQWFSIPVLSSNLFALHCLASVFSTKSIEILTLNLGTLFLSTLLKLVNSEVSQKPLFLFLICDVFVNILPIFSVELVENKEICQLVLSIIESVKSCPYETAKEIYYDISIACMTYAPQFAKSYFSFDFAIHSSRKLKIESLESIQLFLQLTKIGHNVYLIQNYQQYLNSFKDVFVLLQQTDDDRVFEYIKQLCNYSIHSISSNSSLTETISNQSSLILTKSHSQLTESNSNLSLMKSNSSSIESNLSFDRSISNNFVDGVQFNSIANMVFMKNSLPGFVGIEPTQKVKEAALYCIQNVESDRDKLVYLCKALELKLFKAFDILAELNKSHGFISSYKNELINIAKYSIQYYFHLNFLTSLITDETVDDLFELLLENDELNSPEFFKVVTDCCSIAIKKETPNSPEKFDGLLSKLTEIVENVMTHSDFGEFERFVSVFYSNLFLSFVWTEKITNQVKMPTETLYAYLNVQLNSNCKSYQLRGIIKGITAIIKLFNFNCLDLIDESFEGLIRLSVDRLNKLNKEITELVLVSLHKNLLNETIEKIFYLDNFIQFNMELKPILLLSRIQFHSNVKINKELLDYINKNKTSEIVQKFVYQLIQTGDKTELPLIINMYIHQFENEKDALLLSAFIEKFGASDRIAKSMSKFALNSILDNDNNDIEMMKNSIMVIRSINKVNHKGFYSVWVDVDEGQKQLICERTNTTILSITS